MGVDRVHILPDAVFDEFDENPKTRGLYRSSVDAIFIRQNKKYSDTGLLSYMVHELLHKAHDNSSSKKIYRSDEGEVSHVRSGYRLNSVWKEASERLTGFNEIVLVYSQHQILCEAAEFVERELGIPSSELMSFKVLPYPQYATLLEIIAKGISVGDRVSEVAAYEKLVQGQFSNTMLNLKDIEYAFGKGSLRVLGNLGIFEGRDKRRMDSLVQKYFAEPREVVRKKIALNVGRFTSKSS